MSFFKYINVAGKTENQLGFHNSALKIKVLFTYLYLHPSLILNILLMFFSINVPKQENN